jgi:hypothetical protein
MKKILMLLALAYATSVFSQNQERLSVHFFDIPQNMEAEFMKLNKEINLIIENAGFGKNFYKIYKVKADDEAKIYQYFQISSYTSDKHYEMTHKNISEEYNKLMNEFWDSDLGKVFDENRLYRKVFRIDN